MEVVIPFRLERYRPARRIQHDQTRAFADPADAGEWNSLFAGEHFDFCALVRGAVKQSS